MQFIGVALDLLAQAMGFARERSALKNTEAMREAAERSDAVERVDADEKAVAEQDLEKIRKGLAE